MKFALNIEYGNYNNRDRVIVFVAKYNYFTRDERKVECKFHANAIIKTTIDFDINSDMIQIVSDSSSVQYRPKALYKKAKGIYYKLNGKPIYLSQEEINELDGFIKYCLDKKDSILK